MKTSIFGLLFLGLTSLSFSQNQIAFNNTNNNDYLKVKKAKNSAVVTNQISKRITTFQNEVSKYDITSNSIYTPKKPATYTVVFKEANNSITNLYNQNGEVISSEQKFEAIRLPNTINSKILNDYPEWSVNKVNCTIKYEKGKQTITSYKIRINNGAKSKVIKISE